MDFVKVATRQKTVNRRDITEVYPKFVVNNKSSDLMIRGGDFYAIWMEDRGLWSTDEQDLIFQIDAELDRYVSEHFSEHDVNHVRVLHLWDAETGMIDNWHKYCQKQLRDNYHTLDEKLIFSNMKIKKKDYASKSLAYPLDDCDTPGYEALMSVLYSPEERHKIEWAIGSIVNGDSKTIQKFLVFYGAAGTGKSTVLNIIQMLFDGYYSVFDARSLGSNNNAFALEAFKSNPLVAIQHDGDLSHIEDNTKLNSLVSHELMTVNEKFKAAYATRFKSFLFMGTNKPVKITDGRSGLLRRLIDVSPTGDKLSARDYKNAMKSIPFELGGIALRCKRVYEEDPEYYDDYLPLSMMGASNDFFNYVADSYSIFKEQDGTTLAAAWERYNVFCEEARVSYPMSKRVFKEELKTYFREFTERCTLENGQRLRSVYQGFRHEKFEEEEPKPKKQKVKKSQGLELIFESSILDLELAGCKAQLAKEDGSPKNAWSYVKTRLSDLDTHELHYVQVPLNHIVIDFDIPGPNGEKCLERNLEEAAKWPPTYAELSKSGSGVHLHYIYTGDPERLSRIYDDHIEVKVNVGNSALRRKLTKCNNLPIATISSGLPLKGDDKVINGDCVKNEKHLRALIRRNLAKEIHSSTVCSVDFIAKLLNDAYTSGMKYDISDLYDDVFAFAANSTHQAKKCLALVDDMHFKSDDEIEPDLIDIENDNRPIVFYDIEVAPNLLLICYKEIGEGKKCVRMFNPKPDDIERFLKMKLVGFNCRRYDNHIVYSRFMGYSNEAMFQLSTDIINNKSKNSFFSNAYNLSYTDVYDYASTKQSLKKWEIELGIHHKEWGRKWDEPVPEEEWEEFADYCENDVIATEAVWNATQGDFLARQILADVAGLTVNDTTNTLTTRIIFGKERNPQSQFNYRNLAEPRDDMPYFPGYTFNPKEKKNKSMYKGESVGEGGFVWAESKLVPNAKGKMEELVGGMYKRTITFDVASMHPSSIIAENLFGPYTQRFKELLDARIAIKHKDFESAKKMLGGALAKYLTNESDAKALSKALKIAINSVYGLTSASFPNPFRDSRNIDNIVAKRGALFMVNLKEEVQKRGGRVVHIKTDSIKIENPTQEIYDFVMDYGKQYGYNFEIEHIFDRLCLVNNAVYIGKLAADDPEAPGEWTATGAQFAVPYVFKSLFSHEPIEFSDLCEAKSVNGSLYLDMNEDLPEGEHNYVFVGKIGEFCPMLPGAGGGELLREADGKYGSANGAKGYRWLESEVVNNLHLESQINKDYYRELVDDAIAEINKHGDFEQFIS